jgi:hypothetical protein
MVQARNDAADENLGRARKEKLGQVKCALFKGLRNPGWNKSNLNRGA